MSHPIQFYRTGDPYGEFSNFAAFPFLLDDREWRTTEHYFQAKKFEGAEHAEAIRGEPSPMIAARMGRTRAVPLRTDWEEVKDEVMRQALRAKFTQHSALKDLLLSTGDVELIEHTKNCLLYTSTGGLIHLILVVAVVIFVVDLLGGRRV